MWIENFNLYLKICILFVSNLYFIFVSYFICVKLVFENLKFVFKICIYNLYFICTKFGFENKFVFAHFFSLSTLS